MLVQGQCLEVIGLPPTRKPRSCVVTLRGDKNLFSSNEFFETRVKLDLFFGFDIVDIVRDKLFISINEGSAPNDLVFASRIIDPLAFEIGITHDRWITLRCENLKEKYRPLLHITYQIQGFPDPNRYPLFMHLQFTAKELNQAKKQQHSIEAGFDEDHFRILPLRSTKKPFSDTFDFVVHPNATELIIKYHRESGKDKSETIDKINVTQIGINHHETLTSESGLIVDYIQLPFFTYPSFDPVSKLNLLPYTQKENWFLAFDIQRTKTADKERVVFNGHKWLDASIQPIQSRSDYIELRTLSFDDVTNRRIWSIDYFWIEDLPVNRLSSLDFRVGLDAIYRFLMCVTPPNTLSYLGSTTNAFPTVQVEIINASIPPADDLHCVIALPNDSQGFTTRYTKEPNWDELFVIPVFPDLDKVIIHVMKRNTVLGSVTVSTSGCPKEVIENIYGKKHGDVIGQLHLKLDSTGIEQPQVGPKRELDLFKTRRPSLSFFSKVPSHNFWKSLQIPNCTAPNGACAYQELKFGSDSKITTPIFSIQSNIQIGKNISIPISSILEGCTSLEDYCAFWDFHAKKNTFDSLPWAKVLTAEEAFTFGQIPLMTLYIYQKDHTKTLRAKLGRDPDWTVGPQIKLHVAQIDLDSLFVEYNSTITHFPLEYLKIQNHESEGFDIRMVPFGKPNPFKEMPDLPTPHPYVSLVLQCKTKHFSGSVGGAFDKGKRKQFATDTSREIGHEIVQISPIVDYDTSIVTITIETATVSFQLNGLTPGITSAVPVGSDEVFVQIVNKGQIPFTDAEFSPREYKLTVANSDSPVAVRVAGDINEVYANSQFEHNFKVFDQTAFLITGKECIIVAIPDGEETSETPVGQVKVSLIQQSEAKSVDSNYLIIKSIRYFPPGMYKMADCKNLYQVKIQTDREILRYPSLHPSDSMTSANQFFCWKESFALKDINDGTSVTLSVQKSANDDTPFARMNFSLEDVPQCKPFVLKKENFEIELFKVNTGEVAN